MKKVCFFRRLLVIVLLISLCAAGFPSHEAAADDNMKQATVSAELSKPVIASIKNVYQGIKLTWDKVDGAAYYRIYRRMSQASEWTTLADTEASEYQDTSDLIPGATYLYKVRAFGKAGSMSSNSKAKQIIRLPRPSYSIKNGKTGIMLIPYDIGCGSVKGIIVYRKAPGESSYTRIAKVNKRSYIDTDVIEGGTYSYKVCTYISGSKSPVTKERIIMFYSTSK